MSNIQKKVADYYTQKIKEFGASSCGVDWNSKESQFVRFEQLTKILPPSSNCPFSLLDYGCGYGALLDFLNERYTRFHYVGIDISEAMINKAKELFAHLPHSSFYTEKTDVRQKFDYVIASGIFNVKLDTPTETWEKYVTDTLNEFYQLSTKGFAFNILTSYSDKEYRKDYLYYANPCFYFDYCKQLFSKNIALLHDYDLYEFTILVKK